MKSEPPEDFRPAVGTSASPAFGEKTGEKVDLHIGQWKDGRWSYIFGEDTDYRAEMPDIYACDGVEVHDCFSITEYMAIDHFGITKPGESWRAVEDGTIALGGKLPVNPSGGLIGLGHPVGATGVRMLLDSWRQVTGNAGDYQVEGARNFATFNVGGSATTAVSFVVGT